MLEEHQSAYKLLSVDPVELTDQLGEHGVERRILGELDALDAVSQMEELLLADSLTRGEVLTLDGSMRDALDVTQATTLTAVADSDGDSHLPGTCRTATAVGIALDVIGQAVVDDVREVIHVQTASRHVSSDEELEIADAELLHHVVTLSLRELAV